VQKGETMKTCRRFICLIAIITIGLGFTWGISRHVSATNAPQALPFVQNWSNAGLITTNNDWSGVPGIIGYRGNDLSTIIGADLRTVVADGGGTTVGVVANQASPDISAAFGSGGVLEFDGIGNRTIALLPSANADVPHIVLSLDTTGKSNIHLSFKTRDLNTYVGSGNQQINTQFRVGGSGDYANVAGGYVADASGPGIGVVNSVNVTLPPSVNDQSLVEVRIMSINSAAVNVIAIDDINVFGTPLSAPQTLPFHQDWTDTGLITVDNDWSGVPGIIGFQGSGLVPPAGDLRGLVADGSGTPVNVFANKVDTGIILGGAIWEFDGIANPTIAVQGGPVASSPHIVISLNTTGMSNIQLSYNARDLGSPGVTLTEINTQVRIGGGGDYTNIEGGYIPNASIPSGQVTPVSVTLPPSAEDQPLVEVRIITTRGAAVLANNPVGIDDIDISATEPQTPPFGESWSDTDLISVDDDWSDVPGIVGYRGDDLSTVIDADLRTIVADGSDTPVDVNANESDPDTFAEGGVTEFDGIVDPMIALKGSETADVPHIVLSLDTTGLSNVQVKYDAKNLSGGEAAANSQINTQFRTAGSLRPERGLVATGDYTNLEGGYIADASGPDLVTPVVVTLPPEANDQALVEVRIMTINASGDDVYIGIDNIEVTGTAIPTAGTVAASVPSDLSGLPGSTLTVPVNVSDVSGLGVIAYDFTVNYDPAVMTPSDVNFDSDGTLSEDFTITTNPSAPGTLTVSGFGTSPLIGPGALLNLKFDLVGDAPSCSSVGFSSFEFNEGDPGAQTTEGQVCVISGAISGRIAYGTAAADTPVKDVLLTATGDPVVTVPSNSDGTYALTGLGGGPYVVTPEKTDDVNGITAFDAALVAQKVVGIITFTPNQSLSADVSGNGTITSFDAAQIAQYVVEIPNSSVADTWIFTPESRNYPSTTTP